MRTNTLLLLLVCLGSLSSSPGPLLAKTAKPPVKVSNKQGEALTPLSLLDDMKASLIYIVDRSDGINPKAKQAKPYWMALNALMDGIDTMEQGIESQNADMLIGLEDVGRGLTQLSASWAMIRGAYPKSTAGRGIRSLHSSYEMYVEHFGPAVARYRQKTPLSAAEKAHLTTSGQQLDVLFANLNTVYQKVRAKSWQERMLHDLVGLINTLDNVRKNGKGKLGYASYMYQWNRLQNSMWAYSEIIHTCYPDFYQTWAILENDIEVMDTCFGSEEEVYQSYAEWNYLDETIEEYDSYYEETTIVAEVTEEMETRVEEEVEEFDEEEAVAEDAELEEEFEEELDEDEIDVNFSLAEEIGESYGDDDGDGVPDDEDIDDDNDGVSDDEDGDDDGDGVCDTNDGDTEEEDQEEMDEEDDNGIAECVEDDYNCGSCCGGCGDCCE